jgi:uncharacterized membrane protein
MTRKLILIAFLCVAGLPVSCLLVAAVVEAILGDWTGMMFMGAILWALVVLKLAIAVACLYGKPDSAVE